MAQVTASIATFLTHQPKRQMIPRNTPIHTTPQAVSEHVYRLRDKLGLATTPVFVPVRPRDGCSFLRCFHNVREWVTAQGGSVQHGWLVWETLGQLIEGEFHAVWVAPDGALEDITPQRDGETRVLFIPDPDRVYENRPVGNVRLPLVQDPELARTIRFHEQLDLLRAKYHRNGVPAIPERKIRRLVRKFSTETVRTPGPRIHFVCER